MTNVRVALLRKGQYVATPDGAVARVTSDPRMTAAGMVVDARYRNHTFRLNPGNSRGWRLSGPPSDKFVFAHPDLNGPLSEG